MTSHWVSAVCQKGRVVEIFGPESSGKTTVALHIIAEAQRGGGTAAFIDAEHALDPTYAKNLGVDIDNLIVSQPDTGEQALEITEALVRSGAVDVIVIDSVAALVPKAEIDGEMGDTHVGLQARLMSQALRKLAGVISKSSTVAIFINQLREKVGIMFGNPETTPGGRALNSMLRFVLMSVKLKPCATARTSLVREPESKSSRTRLHRHSKRLNLTLSMAKASRARAVFWIWQSIWKLLRRAEPGLLTMVRESARDAIIPVYS